MLQKVQEFELNKNNFSKKEILERNLEIKPFSCKYCDKSFFQVHEVKEHINIHNYSSEVENLTNHPKSMKSQVKESQWELKMNATKRRRNTLSAFLQSESKKSILKDTKTDQYSISL